ncbi:MAG TPA: TetR/AcrR family transcriptional regulator [Pseudonocardiaceae bacterium]|jgi:AcrR family transcriptional regulator
MPRLTDRTRAQRREHILVSAWSCFSRNGFHMTSMDDIIAATGMSSSAVYRYFTGKDEIIDAAAEEALALIRDLFAELLAQDEPPTPSQTIAGLLAELDRRTRDADYDLSKIALHIWAEALRQPGLRRRTNEFYRDVHRSLTELAHRWQTTGHIDPHAQPEQVATVLMTMMPGLIVTRHMIGPIAADDLVAGLSAFS